MTPGAKVARGVRWFNALALSNSFAGYLLTFHCLFNVLRSLKSHTQRRTRLNPHAVLRSPNEDKGLRHGPNDDRPGGLADDSVRRV